MGSRVDLDAVMRPIISGSIAIEPPAYRPESNRYADWDIPATVWVGTFKLQPVSKSFKISIVCRFTSIILSYLRPAVGVGARGSLVVKALCCKPEGRGFDTR
jgi:hypothetical protein